MIFNEQEQQDLIKLSTKNDLVKRLFEEYLSFLEDPAKIYYTALTEAIVKVAEQIKDGTIDVEDPWTKSIMKLSETGDKVFNTLERGKSELTKSIIPLSEEVNKKKDKLLNQHAGKALI